MKLSQKLLFLVLWFMCVFGASAALNPPKLECSSKPISHVVTKPMVLRAVNDMNPNLNHGLKTEIAVAVYDAHRATGVDYRTILGIIKVESHLNPDALGAAGEIGLMQLHPNTLKWMGIRPHKAWDIKRNVMLGTTLYAHYKQAYKLSSDDALLAYNRGPGTVQRYRRAGLDPRNGYAYKVKAATQKITPTWI